MTVVSGGVSGTSYFGYLLASAYAVSLGAGKTGVMSIERNKIITVVDHYSISVAVHPSGIDYRSGLGRYYSGTIACGNIISCMELASCAYGPVSGYETAGKA